MIGNCLSFYDTLLKVRQPVDGLNMTTATLTSKGRITIPAPVRTDLHVGPGDRLEFIKLTDGRYEVVAASQDISCLKGIISSTRAVSIEEMDQAIRKKARVS